MDQGRVDSLFKALGDPARRDLARLLGEAPLTVGEIVEVMRLPQSTVSRHLKALRTTGLLVERREGNRVISALAEPVSNGDSELPDLLNEWLRTRSLAGPVRERLRQVVEGRNGGVDAFDRIAHRWDELRRQYFGVHFHLEALLGLLPEDWRVLDVGTGTGYLLPCLCRQFSQVTAVDPSPAMLRLARQRAQREGLSNVRFHSGSLESLPVADGSVDVVLAILVLHHARDLAKALAEARRALKPGGSLLVVDFKPHSLESFQREMADPVRGLDPSRLMRKMRASGLPPKLHRSLPTQTSEGTGPEKEAPGLYLIKSERS